MQDQRALERKSSAISLSDMEVFIFPELIYSLVLANLMSPRIWAWRSDPWFDGIEAMKPYRRITRLKQYIMDHYVFNLDLDTWGLTTKQRELARFEGIVDAETLARSNALFGYEGDKYYFDIDIRTHFGLDKYEGDVIPYWKTETVEAMDAFRHRPNYETGAGECVSLATLYAAALFIIARIPLEDIYLMATPLHSQNYVALDEGLLTNNRRLVTKAMWFNGTALSAQARRALENERVHTVAHTSGVIHAMHPAMTMDPDAYAAFASGLGAFLSTPLTEEILGSFLRHSRDIQRCFQLRWTCNGVDHYVPMERVFEYEQGSPYRVTNTTREKLMKEIEMEEFAPSRLPSRIVFNDLETFVKEEAIDVLGDEGGDRLKAGFASDCLNAEIAIERLIDFCHTRPQLPDIAAKTRVDGETPLAIDLDMDRDAIEARLDALREVNVMAAMAFYAWRDLSRTEPEPFLKAAMERSPVAIAATADQSVADVIATLQAMPDASIYDGPTRLAQPDEVWNFQRGDGLEKAVTLAAVLRARAPSVPVTIEVAPGRSVVQGDGVDATFSGTKDIGEVEWTIA